MAINKDKKKFVLMTFILVLILGTYGLYALQALRQGEIRSVLLLGAPMAVIVVAVALFMKQGWSSMKLGLPSEDERVKRAANRAGALTYYSLIYVLLALGWFEDLIGFERASQATGLAILISAVIYLTLLTYLTRKADLK